MGDGGNLDVDFEARQVIGARAEVIAKNKRYSPASADPSVLWPPNHKMVDVTVDYTAQSCGGRTTCALSMSSNEPADNTGDGHTAPDWKVVDATHVTLRAERSGSGTGRIYTITIRCTDQLGQTGQATATVTVPHDQRP